MLITLFLASPSAIIHQLCQADVLLDAIAIVVQIHNLVIAIAARYFKFPTLKSSQPESAKSKSVWSQSHSLQYNFSIPLLSQFHPWPSNNHNLVPSLIITCSVWQRFGKQKISAQESLLSFKSKFVLVWCILVFFLEKLNLHRPDQYVPFLSVEDFKIYQQQMLMA